MLFFLLDSFASCSHTHTHTQRRYSITFTESCGVLENDVEIYEFMQPTNSITRSSVLYESIPSPLAHILVDYRNMRQAQMRQAYADVYNTQVNHHTT